MMQRPAAFWRDLAAVAVIGLLWQAFWALQMNQPTYMDAYYYATNGQRLAGGHGFTEEVIWHYLDDPAGLPAPSHTYWMPLPSLLAAAGYLLSDSFRGAQLPFWLLAGLLPLLSFVISRQLVGERWQAWAAALFTAAGGYYNTFYNQPATFAPFAWSGAACLLLLAWAGQFPEQRRWWAGAGALAGLGHLTRADGVLLLVAAGIVAAVQSRGPQRLAAVGRALLPLAAGYLLVMGGWYVRNWLALGQPLPPAGVQTIFLTTYDDLFAYGRSFDLGHLLAWGWPQIIRARLEGVSLALQTFVAVNCLIFLTPFVLWGWRRLRQTRRVWIRPLTVYALLLYGVMSLVFTLPGGRGGLFHSSAAIFPWLMALAPVGIQAAVAAAARLLPHWQPQRARLVFSGLFVAAAFVFSLALGLSAAPPDRQAQLYEALGERLPETAVVMAGDAPGFYYHTKRPSLSVPNEPPRVLLQAAARYGVTHLVLDEDRPLPLDGLYAGQESWPQFELLTVLDGVKLYALHYESE